MDHACARLFGDDERDGCECEIRFGLPSASHYESNLGWDRFDSFLKIIQKSLITETAASEGEWVQYRDCFVRTECGSLVRHRSVFDSAQCESKCESVAKRTLDSQLCSAAQGVVACLVVRCHEKPVQPKFCVQSGSIVRAAVSMRKSFRLQYPEAAAELRLDCTCSYRGTTLGEATAKADSDSEPDSCSVELEVVKWGKLTTSFVAGVATDLSEVLAHCLSA